MLIAVCSLEKLWRTTAVLLQGLVLSLTRQVFSALFRVRDCGYFLAASAANNCGKEAVIESAAGAASAEGGCARSRLDHGLKFHVIPGGCASSRLIVRTDSKTLFVDRPCSRVVSIHWGYVPWHIYMISSTRIKDAGIAIRHSREDILFLYCRVQKQI